MEAAKKVISLLSKSKISSLLKGYADLCDAYISLAYHPVEKGKRRGISSNLFLLCTFLFTVVL